MKFSFIKFLLSIHVGIFALQLDAISCLSSTDFADWREFPGDPIYTPYNVASLPDDYFPYVLFSDTKFDGNGAAVRYKMYHQSPNGIALSYSNNGISWSLVGEILLDPVIAPSVPLHASVIYNQAGFPGGYHYQMWYWTGAISFSPPALGIKFAQSVDGITWTTSVTTTQDSTFFLSDVTQPGQPFYQFYGFGTVIYNSAATSTPGQPFSYPYVAFFDSSAAEQAPQTTQEAVGLAYSSNGINWIRFGAEPVLLPNGTTTVWDGKYAYRASVLLLDGIYHMFYSGSSEINNPNSAFGYTYGIGHASSLDGINWVRDSGNPIFTIADVGEAWRSGRTLAACVIAVNSCRLDMLFSGGTNFGSSFASAAIGFAKSKKVAL